MQLLQALQAKIVEHIELQRLINIWHLTNETVVVVPFIHEKPRARDVEFLAKAKEKASKVVVALCCYEEKYELIWAGLIPADAVTLCIQLDNEFFEMLNPDSIVLPKGVNPRLSDDMKAKVITLD